MAISRGSLVTAPATPERDPYVHLAAGILARAVDDLAGRGPLTSRKAQLDARYFLQNGAGGLFDLFNVDPVVVGALLGDG